MPRRFAFAVVSLASIAAAACGNDRTDHEARLFLDRITTISIDTPAAARRERIEDLEQLALSDPNLVSVRDTCVRGHDALLEAEQEQATAARELGRLTGGRDDAPVAPDAARDIEAAIVRSNAAIEEARDELLRCQAEVAALDQRYSR